MNCRWSVHSLKMFGKIEMFANFCQVGGRRVARNVVYLAVLRIWGVPGDLRKLHLSSEVHILALEPSLADAVLDKMAAELVEQACGRPRGLVFFSLQLTCVVLDFHDIVRGRVYGVVSLRFA